MGAIAIHYDHKLSIHKIDEIALSLAIRIVRPITTLPLVVALIFLLTIGLTYTIITILPVIIARRSNTKNIDFLLGLISAKTLEERDAMTLHVAVEENAAKLDSLIKLIQKGPKFNVFKPLMKQFSVMHSDYERAERALFEYAYPDYHKELTKEEEKELIEAFKPWKKDSSKLLYSGNG